MRITTPQEVARYYQQQKVADEYIRQRFTEPLNVVEHQRQAAILNHIIKKQNIHNVVEFAPGPARITAELEIENGLSIDASNEMIVIAQQRMREKKKRWQFQQKDLLRQPLALQRPAGLVFSFRFLLHFRAEDRRKIYQQASRILAPGGFLVFEALNKKVVRPLRSLLGQKHYFVYDRLYTRPELRRELQENGFEIMKLYPILSHFWLQAALSRPLKLARLNAAAQKVIRTLERFPSPQPYEWIVLCRKKDPASPDKNRPESKKDEQKKHQRIKR